MGTEAGVAANETRLGAPRTEAGDVIQLVPQHRFGGTLWIVDQVHPWGVRAYHSPLTREGTAYVRADWTQFVRVGPATFVLGRE